MSTYWLTFRIEEVNDDDQRRKSLYEAIESITSEAWWTEPTSFIVFSSNLTIDEVAAKARAAIDPDVDLVLVGMTELKAARVIGSWNDPDLTKLIPFVRKG